MGWRWTLFAEAIDELSPFFHAFPGSPTDSDGIERGGGRQAA